MALGRDECMANYLGDGIILYYIHDNCNQQQYHNNQGDHGTAKRQ